MKSIQEFEIENRHLKHVLEELVRLSDLSSQWGSLEPEQLAASLADAMIKAVDLDLVSVALRRHTGHDPIHVIRTIGQPLSQTDATSLQKEIDRKLTSSSDGSTFRFDHSLIGRSLHATVVPFGDGPISGSITAFSQRSNFPADTERLLLQNASHQAELILQRWQAEQDLQRERDLLGVTLESIGDAVITTDVQGRVTFLNAVAQSLTGWSLKDALNQPLTSIFPIINEHSRQPVANPMERVLREGIIVGLANHTLLIAKDGTERPIDDSAAPIRDSNGQLIGAVLVFRDVTEQKKAERALHESEERYRLIGEVANDAIWDWDLVTNHVLWNQGIRSRFGYKAEDVDPDATWWVNHIHPDDRDRIVHGIHEVIDGTEEFWSDEYRFLNADGSSSEVLDRGRVLRDHDGRPLRMIGSMLDLTERKRTEHIIKQKEERYRCLFESMDEGYCIIEMIFNEDGRPVDYLFLEVNQAFEKHTGFHDAAGKRMRDFIPDHDESWFEIYGKVATTGEPIRFTNEATIMQQWFNLYAFRVGGPESRQVAVLFNNVTDQIKGELEREHLLKLVDHERERLDSVFQRAPSFMCVTSGPDHVFERANHQYMSLVGHRDIVGKTVYDALPEIRGQGFIELLDRVYATGEAFLGTNMRVDLQRASGLPNESRYIDFIYQAIRNTEGQITGILTQGIDLTERKRAEAALLENEQRFRDLIAQVEDYAIFLTDENGRPTSWNEGVRHVLGFEEKEFLNIDITTTIFTPEDIAQGVADAELQTAKDFGTANDDRWMMRKDKSRFFASGTTKSLRDESGRLIGFMKVMRDQTRQKEMEDDLRRVAADLSNANRRKDEFLATLAHELRNPLAPIRTGLELLRMAGDDQAMFESVRLSMEEQTQQLVRLVDDLLDMSRITSGKVTLRKERVELAAIVKSAVEATRAEVQQFGHHLTITLPSEEIHLFGDPTRLTQILSNLLTNAIRYTPPGGKIQIAADQEGQNVVLTVTDNGTGIPLDMQDRIFDMFTQIDRSAEQTNSGLGIGLTLVKRLVEMHDGEVEVTSEGDHKGSTFRIILPALAGPSSENEKARTTEEQSIEDSRRVLVVDDNKSAATMLAMVVKMFGQEVKIAHDGLEAVQTAAEFQPHVVLMDLGMPRLNGYEAARQMRQHAWGKDILLVALTGWGQDEDKKRTKEAGFDHHLTKPAEPSEIRKLLASYKSR
jgi:PAS domain S-box-containing protein